MEREVGETGVGYRYPTRADPPLVAGGVLGLQQYGCSGGRGILSQCPTQTGLSKQGGEEPLHPPPIHPFSH